MIPLSLIRTVISRPAQLRNQQAILGLALLHAVAHLLAQQFRWLQSNPLLCTCYHCPPPERMPNCQKPRDVSRCTFW
jgi:hypothetical protein